MTAEKRPDLIARSVATVVGWVARHPVAVLAVVAVVTASSIFLAGTRLGYHTQRNDLLSPNKPCQQRWQKYLDAFGDEDDMVVVAEGTDPAAMKGALDAVAAKVAERPELFDRVFYKVDLRHLRNRALLYLPPEKLDGIVTRLDRMAPLLSSVGPVAWRMLSIESLLGNAALALETRHAGKPITAADLDLLAQLSAIASSAANTVRNPAAYRNPWVLDAERTDRSDARLTEPQYFFTPDNSLALFTCRPKKAADSFTPAKEANAALRAILAELGPRFPGVALGLTGLPVLETDEMELSDADTRRASVWALLGVAALYLVVYRGPRYPVLTLASLVVGTVWALGWATVTVGHLNILSSAFAVMLIGLGDYGVLWVAQYDEARRRGASVEGALRDTALHAGPSIVTAAATTGLAFFAIMLADFRAVVELGWIAGSGVLLCATSCILMMPALIVIAERFGRPVRVAVARGDEPVILPLAALAPRPFVPVLSRHPRLVLAAGAALLLVCGGFATRVQYDHNLLHLQPRGIDSVVWEHKLIARAAGATWDAISLAATRDEALALKAKYEALPEVGRVVEVASLVPPDQGRKLPILKAISDRLSELPPIDRLPTPMGSHPAAVRDLAGRVAQLAGSDTPLSVAAASLRDALDAAPLDRAGERLKAFDRRLGADLAVDLHQLKGVSTPAAITMADVPVPLAERYVGANGEFLVRAFARESLWDHDALTRFTAAASTVDAGATGKAYRTLEGLEQMRVGFEHAAGYALAAIVLVLLLDLRSVRELLLGLFPLAVGVVLTLGVMGLCGVALNPANMVALPLIVGVGVDNGVHVLHDFRGRDRKRAYHLGSATGRGVLVAALTTVLGFGTLMIARHEGMASLGLALTLGVTFCMVAALVFLPAVLSLLDAGTRKREVATRPQVLPLPAAKAA
ncbi:hopanoid biosynthesis associated rnd transporter like protein : Protein export membrane protein, SecD/SecF family, putative OS=Blastopirellula marina DSM 3645 GN=DSM3645_16385 PE=4 SV=1: MMPL: MMPL [Gemmataceae bacterium]|nr:hopanoid biosynthesis associated rnd transporter like protein : Protein export membrane protein, SecD/SecF family, putative OS=Blastopirellula marina DSM 3645 GN=DSM3645_16385 PE=4 SV=1: MMPL: MMPL [Gemmataceae bacterium]VTT96935.1 hopanoid biosynthesis associated rnd transporter like protein : Protein export membrane protein, SecD/SecF family, putative OS=Blastopirellula marina DSM 3645 GN=DSM3645_16385 PE=4 SV=1: MMPL: MMPL [Gemmataceae bacterium]